MCSVKSSVKGWKAAAIVLIVIVLQVLGLRAARAEEPAKPRIDEEITKQDKIYNSRGADVPEGYITGRTFTSYLQVLSSGFCGSLATLGSSDRWLDIGAGAGQAIVDYYTPNDDSASGKTCAGAGGKVRAVAMSIEDRRTDSWQQQAASLGDGRARYFYGKRLREYSPEELGKFQIIPTSTAASRTQKIYPFSWRKRWACLISVVFSTRWYKACVWKMAKTTRALGI